MVTTEALKLLYKKLGGSADVEHITSTSTMIDLIEDVAGGGGGGASGLVVHELEDVDSGDYYLDKNYAEIETAVNNGQPVMVYSIPDGSANRIDILYVNAIRYDAEAQTMAYAVFAGEYIYGSDSNTGRLTASS